MTVSIKTTGRIKLFFLLSIVSFHLSACSYQPLKIGVISDIHYLSPNIMDNGDAVDNYYMSTGRNIKDISEILDNVIEEYIQESIDILLIPGDLTKDGEKQSHTELAEKLAKLNRHGIQVFVIPGKP